MVFSISVAEFDKPLQFLLKNKHCLHRRTGPVSFKGAEVSCPNIFSIACPKIKWFCPKMAI